MSLKAKRRKSDYKSALTAWKDVAKRYGLKSTYGVTSAHTPTFWQWIIPDKFLHNPKNKTTKKKSGSVRKRSKSKTGRNPELILANKRSRNKKKKVDLDSIYKGAIVGLIPGAIETIFYNRTGTNPGKYKHEFEHDTTMFAMDDGSVLITPKKKGVNLWTKI